MDSEPADTRMQLEIHVSLLLSAEEDEVYVKVYSNLLVGNQLVAGIAAWYVEILRDPIVICGS